MQEIKKSNNLKTACLSFQQRIMGNYFFLLLAFYSGFLGCYQHKLWYLMFPLILYRFPVQKKQRQLLLVTLLFLSGICVSVNLKSKENAPLRQVSPLIFKPGDFQVKDQYFSGVATNQSGQKMRVTMKKWPHTLSSHQKLVLEGNGEELPFQEAENFGGFSAKKYYQQQGIYHQVELTKITKLKQEKSWQSLFQLRQERLLQKMQIWPEVLRSFYQGAFFRQKDDYFYQQELSYQRSGLFQIFFFSGLQFYCLLLFFQMMLLRLGVTHETTQLLLLVLSVLVMGVVGFQLTFVRLLLWRCSRYLPRELFSPLDKFSLIVFFTQLFFPYQLFQFSGQMIYLASFLFLVPLGKGQLYQKGIYPLLLAPLFWWHFFEWSPLILLFFPLLRKYYFKVFLVVLGSFGLCWVHPFFQSLFADIFQFFLNFLPQYYWVVGRPPWSLFLSFYLLAILCCLKNQGKIKFPTLAITFFFFLILANWSLFNPKGELTFVNVRQGDSILLKSPFKKEVILMDVGGKMPFGNQKTRSVASQTLIPYLKSRGIKKINKVLVSHADYDHMGDLLEVSKHFLIDEVHFQKGSTEKDLMRRTLQQLPPTTQFVTPKTGDTLPFHQGRLTFLGPEIGDGSNDASLQYLLEMFQLKILLTGDIEEKGENQFIKDFPQLKVDLLKVGHHGSKTSTTAPYLKQLQPKVAVIQRGATNQFGHPHQEVVTRLKEANIQIYDTGEVGTIRYFFSKNQFFSVETLHPVGKK